MKLTRRLNQIVNVILIILAQVLVSYASAQSIDLNECYRRAEKLSPLKQQEQYIATIDELSRIIENNAFLPQILLKGSATYQSDVFMLPFDPPGAEIPQIPKDQYQFTLNVSQNLYDGGLVKSAKQQAAAETDVRQQQLKVSLYQVRNVINGLFFGILIQETRERLKRQLMDELQNQSGKVAAGIENGVLLPSVSMEIKKEYLKAKQELNTIQFNLLSSRKILSDWIGMEVTSDTDLVVPEAESQSEGVSRPELSLFESKSLQLEANKSMLNAYRKPRLMAFANLGYGNPNALNFFETNWSTYYMVGGKLEWNLWDWNNTKKRKQVLELNREIIKTEKANFEKQISDQLIQQQALIQQLEASLQTDKELIDLQKKITMEAEHRFRQGAMTASDYLTELNNLKQAQLQYDLHQIQITRNKIEYQTISGDIN